MPPPFAAAASTGAVSATAQILQRRAIQCSFSSIFHLRNSGVCGQREAAEAEKIFFRAVVVPLGIMGLVGSAAYAQKTFQSESSVHTNFYY